LVIAQKEGEVGETGTVESVRVQPGLLIQAVGLFARACYAFDRWVVDGMVNAAGWVGRLIGRFSGWIDKTFVDGLVNEVGNFLTEFADVLKLIQTGNVQNYLLFAMAIAAFAAFAFMMK
jgi:NADH:ubiquinone oxidoreductase subunit 5 (subunit L)/multisubunit Na+/H+ antiporter MnhA subunit